MWNTTDVAMIGVTETLIRSIKKLLWLHEDHYYTTNIETMHDATAHERKGGIHSETKEVSQLHRQKKNQ